MTADRPQDADELDAVARCFGSPDAPCERTADAIIANVVALRSRLSVVEAENAMLRTQLVAHESIAPMQESVSPPPGSPPNEESVARLRQALVDSGAEQLKEHLKSEMRAASSTPGSESE